MLLWGPPLHSIILSVIHSLERHLHFVYQRYVISFFVCGSSTIINHFPKTLIKKYQKDILWQEINDEKELNVKRNTWITWHLHNRLRATVAAEAEVSSWESHFPHAGIPLTIHKQLIECTKTKTKNYLL